MLARRRHSRAGTGLLPPNPRQWQAESNGLDLRDELGLDPEDQLDHIVAFERMLPHVEVVAHGGLAGVPRKIVDHFRTLGARSWSGMGVPLPNGTAMVIYNDSHPMNRIRATLMEEFFHLRLEHAPSLVRIYAPDGAHRAFEHGKESEAYASGAAALLPYRGLKGEIDAGRRAFQIARNFSVSEDLVIFRAKVTKLYGRLRA